MYINLSIFLLQVCVEYRLRINILRKTCDRFYEAGNITKGKLLMFTLDSKVSNDEKNKQIKQQKKSNKSRLMNKSGCGAFFVMFLKQVHVVSLPCCVILSDIC